MKKICPICLTVFEDANIEHCPECYDKIKVMPKMLKTEMDLRDYDEYIAFQNRLNDPNSFEGKNLNKMLTQMQSQNNSYAESQNIPKCPICGSTNLKKLNVVNRSASAFMWGFASNKIGKTWECKNCKSTF